MDIRENGCIQLQQYIPLTPIENSLPPNELATHLFTRTFQHPILGSMIEWVPTQWLFELSNPNVTPDDKTDLGTWDYKPEMVSMEQLFQNIVKNGMRDPFIVGIGRVTRRTRLEAGNHRIRIFLAHGISLVPAIAYVGDSAITWEGNGTHEGKLFNLRLPSSVDILGPYPIKKYMPLSHALAVMPR